MDLSNFNVRRHLAREELGWEPKVALKEGLQETINYFKKII